MPLESADSATRRGPVPKASHATKPLTMASHYSGHAPGRQVNPGFGESVHSPRIAPSIRPACRHLPQIRRRQTEVNAIFLTGFR